MKTTKPSAKAHKIIEASIFMDTYEAVNLKPIAWAIVASACILAGAYLLNKEYEYIAGCRISYLDNSGMLLNSCEMYDETNDGFFSNQRVINIDTTQIN